MMKTLKYIVLSLVLAATATTAEAKIIVTEHMYIFGFSASFLDSTLYITDIQDVQGASYDTKDKFLLGRELYSNQLKEFLTDQKGQANRICLVMFATTRKEAEKLCGEYLSKVSSKDKKFKLSKPEVKGLIYIPCTVSGNRITCEPLDTMVPERMKNIDAEKVIKS